MKTFKKIILSVFIFLIFIFFAGGLSMYFYGKPLVKRILQDKIEQDVTFSSITYHAPFGMDVTSLRWGDNFQANKVSVQLDPSSFLGSRIRIFSCDIEAPFIRVIFPPDKDTGMPSNSATKGKNSGRGEIENQKGAKYSLWIHSLAVKDGGMVYSRDGSLVELNDVQLKGRGILLPSLNSKITLQFTGSIKQPQNFLQGSSVSGKGWFNWPLRNMQATLQIIAPLKAGRLFVDMVSENNDLQVSGHINIAKELLQKNQQQQGDASQQEALVNMLAALGVRVGADFSFATKMDDLKLEKISFSGKVIQNNP